jgi:hypothetical protein
MGLWAGWSGAPLRWENGTHGVVFTHDAAAIGVKGLVRMIEQVDDCTI